VDGKQLLTAVKSGEAQVLTKDKLLERIAAADSHRSGFGPKTG